MHALRIAVFAVLFAACSAVTATVDRSALLFTNEPPPRPGCKIIYQPGALPALSQLADSAALITAVTQYAEEHPLNDGELRAVYSVGFDASGRVQRVKPIDYWLPQGEADAFTQLVRRHLRPQLRESGSVRLLLEPGSDPVARVGRSERCPPVSGSTFHLTAPAVVQLEKPRPMRVRLRVSERGDVVGQNVLSSSGNEELDRWVVGILERYEFAPGLIDGEAVAMDHEETVQIQTR
jgi:TonB family protein